MVMSATLRGSISLLWDTKPSRIAGAPLHDTNGHDDGNRTETDPKAFAMIAAMPTTVYGCGAMAAT
jgi:hypothetical protein